MLGRARARRPEHADAVRFVDIRARAVRLGEFQDAAQIRDIAFHAEHALTDDEDLFLGRAVLQAPLEMIHVVVPEAYRARRRAQRPLHQAGMQIVIADHHVALLGQGAERRVIGLEPGAEYDCGLFMNECGQVLFQLYVNV